MRNLTGFLNRILLILFSFAFIFLSNNKVLAQTEIIKSSGDLDYYVNDTDLECEYSITLASDSSYPTYIHYFTVNVPFTGIDEVFVTYNNQKIESTIYINNNSTQINPDFKGIVVKAGLSQNFIINFKVKDYIGLSDPKIKRIVIPANFASDLVINSVSLSYSQSIGDLNYVSIPFDNTRTNGIVSEIIFNNPKVKNITALIGSDVVYNIDINEKFFNFDSEKERVVEINIPKTNYNQSVVIEDIFPTPSYSKIDESGNIKSYFVIEPNGEKEVSISTQVIMGRNESEVAIGLSERQALLSQNDYWRISDNDVIDELKLYKASLTDIREVESYYNYILSIFSPNFINERTRLGSSYNFENRIGLSNDDYTDSLIALLRSNHIPARMVAGFIYDDKNENSVYLHSWVEYWDESNGWKILDPALDEINETDDFGIDYYDHIAIVSREENPISPNILYSGTSTLNVKLTSTHSDPFSNIEVDFSSISKTNIQNESLLNITVENTGNIPILLLSVNIGEETINLLEEGYVLLPSESVSKAFSTDSANNVNELSINYEDTIGNEKSEVVPMSIETINLWWWEYLIGFISLTIFTSLLTFIYFLYNKIKYEKK